MHFIRVLFFAFCTIYPFARGESTTAAGVILYFNSVYQAAYLNLGTQLKPPIAPAPVRPRAPRQTRPDPRLNAKELLLNYIMQAGFPDADNARVELRRYIENDPALDATLRTYDPDPKILEASFSRQYSGIIGGRRPRAIWNARANIGRLFPRLNRRASYMDTIQAAEEVMRLSAERNTKNTAHFRDAAISALQYIQQQRTIANGDDSIAEFQKLQSGRIHGRPAMRNLTLSTKLLPYGNIFQEVIDVAGTIESSPGLTAAEKTYLANFLVGRDVDFVVSDHSKIIQRLDRILVAKRAQTSSGIGGACQI